MSVDKKKFDCTALPKGWQREEIVRKSGLSAGKVDIYYYSPSGHRFRSKPQLARYLGDTVDLSSFDFRTGNINNNALRKNETEAKRDSIRLQLVGVIQACRLGEICSVLSCQSFHRGVRTDASLVPPIRQTASIFKQPVTVHKSQEGKVKTDFKQGPQDKPKQLFWEKRLEGLRACDIDGLELDAMELPKGLRPVGPHVGDETLLQSVATALHVSTQPVTGQTGSRSALDRNPGVFLNPEQPLVQAVQVIDDDIKRQEDRVLSARKKLQEALKV